MWWGGNLKPFDIMLGSDSGSTSTNDEISASVALPYNMVKKVELWSLFDHNYGGSITLTIKGFTGNYNGNITTTINKLPTLATKTANRSDISESNPLVLDLTNVKKYKYLYIRLSGTGWSYEQIGMIKVYPR